MPFVALETSFTELSLVLKSVPNSFPINTSKSAKFAVFFSEPVLLDHLSSLFATNFDPTLIRI